jgi:hypothetical protein
MEITDVRPLDTRPIRSALELEVLARLARRALDLLRLDSSTDPCIALPSPARAEFATLALLALRAPSFERPRARGLR